MKQLKKIASIMLALVMVLAMAIPVMAEDEEAMPAEGTERGTITINNAIAGENYKIYKVFDLVYNGNNYLYTVADEWKGFEEQDNSGLVTYKEENGVIYAIPDKDANTDAAETFAALAKKYAETENISATKDTTAPGSKDDKEYKTVTFNDLDLGYYLVGSAQGTVCSLDTTDPAATINDKNPTPSIEKEVKEGEYGSVNDASIGDRVDFQATITVQVDNKNYKMHDRMSDGLTFKHEDSDKGIDGITLTKPNGTNQQLTENTHYSVVWNNEGRKQEDGCTFEIVFVDDALNLEPGDKLVVDYHATVNAGAVIAGNGNTNTAQLIYGDTPANESTTTTYVWEFDMSKIDGASTKREPLAGAQFTLYRTYEEKTLDDPISFVSVDDEKVTDGDVYRVATEDDDTDKVNTVIITGDNGKIYFRGLDSGTYYLKETEAPAGYNTPTEPVVVQINFADSDNNGEKECTILHDGEEGAIEIVNNTGAVLPSTGGIGTTIFYVVGGILVVGAAIVLVAKKRTKDE